MYLNVLMNMSVLRCENPTFQILDPLLFFYFILFVSASERTLYLKAPL